jgi:hypothetical protein
MVKFFHGIEPGLVQSRLKSSDPHICINIIYYVCVKMFLRVCVFVFHNIMKFENV